MNANAEDLQLLNAEDLGLIYDPDAQIEAGWDTLLRGRLVDPGALACRVGCAWRYIVTADIRDLEIQEAIFRAQGICSRHPMLNCFFVAGFSQPILNDDLCNLIYLFKSSPFWMGGLVLVTSQEDYEKVTFALYAEPVGNA